VVIADWPKGMADYYRLIRNAIDAAEEKTDESRRVFYERARTALVDHFRKADPPLSETVIEQERLALEEAISKVEAEATFSEGTQPIPNGLQAQSDHTEDAIRTATMYRTWDATMKAVQPDAKEQRERRFAFWCFLILSALWIGDVLYEPPSFFGWYDWLRLGGATFLPTLAILSYYIMRKNLSAEQEERAYIVWTPIILVGAVLVSGALYFTFGRLATTPSWAGRYYSSIVSYFLKK
jgi:hypothetical protein